MRYFYSLLLCTFFAPQYLFSQTWNGSVSSDWNVAANWTPGSVPGSGNTVIINNRFLTHYPILNANTEIGILNMSAGILNLNGNTLTCSASATLTGDSLYNGKISAASFSDLANMHMGGKIIFERTGSGNQWWQGNNKFYGDSLIIVWKSGTLHLQNSGSSPDSIFGNLKIQLTDASSVYLSLNSPLSVQNNLVLDNIGNGIFYLNNSSNTVIGGNLVTQNFSSSTSIFPLSNVTVLGSNPNGPYYCHRATINNCYFNGSFTLIADSNALVTLYNSSLFGADNLLQAGNIDAYGNKFGKAGDGTTILRAAYNLSANVYMRSGNNKFIGNAQWETYAAYPGSITIQNNWYGPDTCLQNLNFILKGNSAITTNGNGHNYVAGNVIIDGQGARKWVEFSGGTGNDFTVQGNFTAKNFTRIYEPGITYTSLFLHNLYVAGSDTMGTFYCRSGDINNSSFSGDLKIIADSNFVFGIYYSSLLGANNLIQAGSLDFHDNQFGQTAAGTTILRGTYNEAGSFLMRDGKNKFWGNVNFETYALYPGSITLQQTYHGQDSCLGNMNFMLKGNSVLTTNGNGHNYVAGDVIIDGQGARKWVEFDGGSGVSFNIGGNFIAKNFTRFSEPGAGPTNVYLHNVYVAGTDTCGTFYCLTGDINNCSFNGNFKLIGDSSYTYYITNSSFHGADNLLQAASLDFQNNQFGQIGVGTTILRAAYVGGGYPYMRDGNNKFFGNATWETYSPYPGGITIQQTFYGADSCHGNMNFILKGNSTLTTNGNGNNYVAGNVIIDGQGARKWIQFFGGTGNTFNVGGSFTVKNFTPYSVQGVGGTNVYLHNINVTGTDTVGTFYCYTGDVNSCSFKGNFKLIADSAQPYAVYNSEFSGANNFFQAGNLDIYNNRFGQTGNGITTFNVSHNMGAPIGMRDGLNKFLNDLDWIAVAPSYGSILIQQTFYGTDTCFGNLTMDLIGPASANLAGNNLYLGKGLFLQNSGSGSIVHDNGGSAVRFIGVDTANYLFTGTGSAPSFINIEMNRRGGLRLLSPLSYTGTLALTRGIILSSSSNQLEIPNGAVVISASDSGYVDGPVKKTGNSSFTFPVGNNNFYAPITITAPPYTTDAFSAQYLNHRAGYDGYDSTLLDVSLNHLSRREYWMLNRTNGTASVKVTMSWKRLRSGVIDQISDLRIAHWNGTMWRDEGNGGTTGGNDSGSIETLNYVGFFSPFTLASISLSNPLPLKYISFTAQLNSNKTVSLQWKTSEEINNEHFEIERSIDGVTWFALANISTNTTHQYSYLDQSPKQGLNYYRIKEVDIDGKYFYSATRAVTLRGEKQLFIWPNPATTELHLQLPVAAVSIEIINATGQVVFTKIISTNNEVIPVQQLKAGIYFLKIKYQGETHVEKFLKE